MEIRVGMCVIFLENTACQVKNHIWQLFCFTTFSPLVHSASLADEPFLLCAFTVPVLQSCAPNRDVQLGACLKCIHDLTAAR